MEYLPVATLGAIIVAASIGIVDLDSWRGLARLSRVEVAIAAVTMVGVVSVGVLRALLLAVALSVVDAVRRSATPHDAVLGWVDRLDRYADVRLHPAQRRLYLECWSIGSMTGCSLRMPTMSRGGFARLSQARRARALAGVRR